MLSKKKKEREKKITQILNVHLKQLLKYVSCRLLFEILQFNQKHVKTKQSPEISMSVFRRHIVVFESFPF